VTEHTPEDLLADPPEYAPVQTSRPLKRRRRATLEWALIVVVAVVASFVVRTFLFQTYVIPSGSMEPTLMIGDRIIVDKLSVDFGTIHTGDIVVFDAPPNALQDCSSPGVTVFVKRVIGVPGDQLTSKGNTIYIKTPGSATFQALDEKWTHSEPLGPPIGHVTVSAGHYFMMGDNHNDSCDSRTWGTVARKDLIGKAFVRIWPLARIGFL
jgi:signal peptidase I